MTWPLDFRYRLGFFSTPSRLHLSFSTHSGHNIASPLPFFVITHIVRPFPTNVVPSTATSSDLPFMSDRIFQQPFSPPSSIYPFSSCVNSPIPPFPPPLLRNLFLPFAIISSLLVLFIQIPHPHAFSYLASFFLFFLLFPPLRHHLLPC